MSVLASASNDLKFHQWPDGTLQQTYLPANYDEGPIKSISWSKDGSWLVVVPHSGPAEVISTINDNVKLLQKVQEIYNPSCATFQNSTKRFVAIGTAAGQVLVYDLKSSAIRKRFPRINSTIFNLEYNAKDSHIAVACASGEILLLSNQSSNISCSYRIPKSDSVSCINFHRTKRNLLVAGSEEGIVATWDINTNAVQCDIQAHHGPVTNVAFSAIRADLLVSSGLDRRFAFYDLVAKRCVLEVEVSSCITSLDFSCCGMYLGVGAQNGNVVLYDTRNLSQPISAFSAHEGKKICHLRFQKVPVSNDESTFDLVSDEVPQKQLKELEHKNLTDSLGFVICDDTASHTREEPARKLSQDAEDSFLAAMGCDRDNSNATEASLKQTHTSTMGLGITQEVKKWMNSTTSKRTSIPPNLHLNSHPHTPATSLKQLSSTPKYLLQEMPASAMSPIIGANGDAPANNMEPAAQASASPEGLKEMIREVVREELQTSLQTQMQEVRMEFNDMLSHMRRHFLDLQMSLAKEFVAMEATLDKTNNVTVREFVCDDFLISQNNQLLREVETLKERLAEKDITLRRKY